MQEVSLKRWKKKKVRKYFPLFPFFPSLVCFLARESEMRKRERERTTKRVCRARRIFEANLTGFPPFISTLENHRGRQRPILWLRSLRIAHPRAFRRIGHEKRPRDESCWRGRRKGKRKKKMENEKQEKREKEGRKKNSGSWLSSSEKEEASAMNCRAFMGGKMARRYFEEEKKSKRQHR